MLVQDTSGLTALHWAASRGREACVAALLAKGADPTCQSHTCDGNLGYTAAELASSAGHTGIAAVLAEFALVHALSKAQTGRLPASTVSLLGETSPESDAQHLSESYIQPQTPWSFAGLRCCFAPKRQSLQADVSIVHDHFICNTAAEIHCRASRHGLRSQCHWMGCFQPSCICTADARDLGSQYNTWLVIKLTLKGIVFSFILWPHGMICTFLQLGRQFDTSALACRLANGPAPAYDVIFLRSQPPAQTQPHGSAPA